MSRESRGRMLFAAKMTISSSAAGPRTRNLLSRLWSNNMPPRSPKRAPSSLVGNVAHALPAADGTVALLALDAEAQVARRGQSGVSQQWLPLPSLFKGPG